MRQKIVAGNWKMNTTLAEGVELVKGILENASKVDKAKLIVAPPFTHLAPIADLLKGSNIALAAQNCASEEAGAYTGEVSAKMLASAGVQYVILGHSERREYYSETSATLFKKVQQVFAHKLLPIFCIGERLDERESNCHFDIVKKQLEEVVFQLSVDDFEKVVIAYEPVWAIGTGKTATPEQAQEMHAFIRKTLAQKFGSKADDTAILYGGSAKPSNAKELFSNPDVDGGLIGGASLVAADFIAIAQAF